jgi:hypothetical protein
MSSSPLVDHLLPKLENPDASHFVFVVDNGVSVPRVESDLGDFADIDVRHRAVSGGERLESNYQNSRSDLDRSGYKYGLAGGSRHREIIGWLIPSLASGVPTNYRQSERLMEY